MKIGEGIRQFHKIEDVPQSMNGWIKYKIPVKFRVFSNGWYVHEKYVMLLATAASKFKTSVDTAALPGYLRSQLGAPNTDAHSTLFVTEAAPDFVVDAVWKALAKYYHPDASTGDHELFLKYKKAYDELKG